MPIPLVSQKIVQVQGNPTNPSVNKYGLNSDYEIFNDHEELTSGY